MPRPPSRRRVILSLFAGAASWVCPLVALAGGAANAGRDACVPASVAPRSNADVSAIFATARADLEARRWQDAAASFRYLAMHHADKDVGAEAAPLYLEAISNLYVRASSQATCADDLARDAPRLQASYCEGARATKNAVTCSLLEQVRFDLARVAADAVASGSAGAGVTDTRETNAKAATLYWDAFSKYCETNRAPAARPRGCDDVLFYAARAQRVSGEIHKAIDTYRRFLRLDSNTLTLVVRPSSPSDDSPTTLGVSLKARATHELGDLYQGLAEYELAAEHYERFAVLAPQIVTAADRALSDAVALRLGLGQVDAARADMDLFRRSFGDRAPLQAAQVVLAVTTALAEREAWADVRAILGATTEPLFHRVEVPVTPLDLQIRAHALQGRAAAKMGDVEAARTEYAKLHVLWGNPLLAGQRIRAAWARDDEATVARREARAVAALSEAFFAEAEAHRAATTLPLAFPVHAGSPVAADLMRHIETRVKPWYDRKIRAINDARRRYDEIADAAQVPSPIWVVRSNARVAQMWTSFADELARALSPPAWLKGDDARRDYVRAIEALWRPVSTLHATSAARHCVTTATKLEVLSDEVDVACAGWLARASSHGPERAVGLTDELRPSLRAPTSADERTYLEPFKTETVPLRARRAP